MPQMNHSQHRSSNQRAVILTEITASISCSISKCNYCSLILWTAHSVERNPSESSGDLSTKAKSFACYCCPAPMGGRSPTVGGRRARLSPRRRPKRGRGRRARCNAHRRRPRSAAVEWCRVRTGRRAPISPLASCWTSRCGRCSGSGGDDAKKIVGKGNCVQRRSE
jgi:hypothetical protein